MWNTKRHCGVLRPNEIGHAVCNCAVQLWQGECIKYAMLPARQAETNKAFLLAMELRIM